jgi:hypothetical protein
MQLFNTAWLLKGIWDLTVGLITILVALLQWLWACLDLGFHHLRRAIRSLWRCARPTRPARRTPGRILKSTRQPDPLSATNTSRWWNRLLCFLRLQPRTRTLTLNGGHRIRIIERPGDPGFEIRTEKGFEHLAPNAISYIHAEVILQSLIAKKMQWD